MSFKKQIEKIKENWLFIFIFLIILGVFFFLPNVRGVSKSYDQMSGAYENYSLNSTMGNMYYSTDDFYPEITERKITMSANLDLEVKIGELLETHEAIKKITNNLNLIVLNENINSYKIQSKEIYRANYILKVEQNKLEFALTSLKNLGKVTNITKESNDITEKYLNTTIELEVEQKRMERYQQMYSDALEMKDKIELNDRIFNQERTIKYLEDSLKNVDNKIDYSTIYLSVNEKSDYLGIAFIKLSELSRAFIDSLNSLITLLVTIFPWALVVGFSYVLVKATKKRKINLIKRK